MLKKESIISIFLIISLLLSPIISASAQQATLDEEIEVRVDTYGGNVNTLIKVSGEALKTLNKLVAYIPSEFINQSIDKITITGDKGGTSAQLDFDIERKDDLLLIQIPLTDKYQKITIGIYQPERLDPLGDGKYILRILSFVKFNAVVETANIKIRPPLDVSASEPDLPTGFSQIQVSPEGVSPAQFEISRFFTETEIRLINNTKVEDIVLQQRNRNKVSLILADAMIYMKLYPDYTGKIKGNMNVTIQNKDNILWPKGTEIQFNKLYEFTSVKTELGVPVDTDFTGRVYKILIPYQMRPNDKVTFNIEFEISENVSLTEEILPKLRFNFTLAPPLDIPINEFEVVFTWNDQKITKKYYTVKDERINVSGELNMDVLSILNQSGASYILFIILMLALGIVVYSNFNKFIREELPEEVREYLEEFVEEMGLMDKAIDLERRHLEGRIKDKEYIRERSKIHRQIRDIRRKASKNRSMLEKMAADNPTLKEVLEEIKEVEKTWEELNKLEDSRRRRAVTLEEYKEARSQLITKFEIYSTKVKRRL